MARSLIDLPKPLRQSLEEDGTPEALEQLRQEHAALHYLRRVEVVLALARRRQLPSGFELCMCDTMQELLSEPQFYHLYLKYIRTLQDADINVPRDISTSYASVLDMLTADMSSGLHRQIVGVGFRITDFLVALEMWLLAEEVILNIINFLKANPAIENWVSLDLQLMKPG